MNKRPLTTTIVTHIVRGASFIVLLFIGINVIRFAQAQPQSNKSSINSETSHNDVRGPVGTKTLVKVHDNSERTQIASPQQNYSAPVQALHRALFVAWSPVRRTDKSPLILMVER